MHVLPRFSPSLPGTVLGLVDALLLGIAVSAAAAPWKMRPEVMLEQTTQQMLTVLRQNQAVVEKRPQELYTLVDQTLGAHVDFPLVARLVLGKYWRRASAAQRKRFTTEFRKLLVRFYTSALLDDPKKIKELLAKGNALITFQPTHIGPSEITVNVRSEVHLPSGQVVPVTFSMHHKGAEWMVYDVNVEGISLVTTYRSNFSTEIRQAGLDAMLDKLAARNKELLEQTKALH